MSATLTVRKNEGPKYRYLKFKLDAKHKHLGATSEQIALTLCDSEGRAYQLKGTDVIKLPSDSSSEPWAQTYPVLCSTHKSGNFILYIKYSLTPCQTIKKIVYRMTQVRQQGSLGPSP
jgi:hypothetical protein